MESEFLNSTLLRAKMVYTGVSVYLLAIVCYFFVVLIKERNDGLKMRKSDKSPSPPAISILKLLWRFVYKGRNISNALLYIGEVNPVVRIKFFMLNAVVINDFTLGKEAFRKSVFSGKSSQDTWCYPTGGPHGIMNSVGKKWEQQKRFCQKHLRNFGFGTISMESLIKREIEDFMDICKLCQTKTSKQGLISPNKMFYLPILNSIWMILGGERSSTEDEPLFQMTLRLYNAFIRAIEFPELVVVFLPFKLTTIKWITTWFPFVKIFFPGLVLFHAATEELRTYCQELISNRQKSSKSANPPQDLTDIYLNEIHITSDESSEFFKGKGVNNLLAVMIDFFLAGGHTTATMLQWNILHLIRNPSMQKKIQEEIDSVVGYQRGPSLADRPNCPYTEAFLEEVLRFTPVSKASLPHEALEDTYLGEYFILKGTPIFLNIESIHRDPKIWGDPEIFRPERFLSTDGSTFIQHEAMIAFSIGRRRCIGEQLARDNMFLFISSICHRFTLERDPKLKARPRLASEISGVNSPKTFHMVAHYRYYEGFNNNQDDDNNT